MNLLSLTPFSFFFFFPRLVTELMADPTFLHSQDPATELEVEKLRLEQARYRADVLKWVVIAVGAVISFSVIDYGKLQLERFRVAAENQRELLNAYLKATESPAPEVWKRKLSLIINSPSDEQTKDWAKRELEYIEGFAALDALYRETLKIASQLVEPQRMNAPDRIQARARYNQLYWADLPFAGESPQVIAAMVAFRNQLIKAESNPDASGEWGVLNVKLIDLSKALRESAPHKSIQPTGDSCG